MISIVISIAQLGVSSCLSKSVRKLLHEVTEGFIEHIITLNGMNVFGTIVLSD